MRVVHHERLRAMTCEIHGREFCACLDRRSIRALAEAKRRSWSYVVLAIVCTVVSLAVVAVMP